MRLSTIGELAAAIIHESIPYSDRHKRRNKSEMVRSRTIKPGQGPSIDRSSRSRWQTCGRSGFWSASIGRKVRPGLADVDLNEVVREGLILLRDEIRRGAVNLDVNLPEAVGFVIADKVQLQQVLLNLIATGLNRRDRVLEVITECGRTGELPHTGSRNPSAPDGASRRGRWTQDRMRESNTRI